MTVLYLSVEKETSSNSMDIPHDIICGILSEVDLRNDRNSEKKAS